MKDLNGPFFNAVRGKVTNCLKELIDPKHLEGTRLNLFGGSIGDYMRFLKSQKPGKDQ